MSEDGYVKILESKIESLTDDVCKYKELFEKLPHSIFSFGRIIATSDGNSLLTRQEASFTIVDNKENEYRNIRYFYKNLLNIKKTGILDFSGSNHLGYYLKHDQQVLTTPLQHDIHNITDLFFYCNVSDVIKMSSSDNLIYFNKKLKVIGDLSYDASIKNGWKENELNKENAPIELLEIIDYPNWKDYV